jgi:hypothetical protein
LRVQLPGGAIEWWQISGVTERNVGGQPVYLGGHMHVISESPGL